MNIIEQQTFSTLSNKLLTVVYLIPDGNSFATYEWTCLADLLIRPLIILLSWELIEPFKVCADSKRIRRFSPPSHVGVVPYTWPIRVSLAIKGNLLRAAGIQRGRDFTFHNSSFWQYWHVQNSFRVNNMHPAISARALAESTSINPKQLV